jgi:hypothetical protein
VRRPVAADESQRVSVSQYTEALFAGDSISPYRNSHAQVKLLCACSVRQRFDASSPLRLRQCTADYAKAWRAHTVHVPGLQIRGGLGSKRVPVGARSIAVAHVASLSGWLKLIRYGRAQSREMYGEEGLPDWSCGQRLEIRRHVPSPKHHGNFAAGNARAEVNPIDRCSTAESPQASVQNVQMEHQPTGQCTEHQTNSKPESSGIFLPGRLFLVVSHVFLHQTGGSRTRYGWLLTRASIVPN